METKLDLNGYQKQKRRLYRRSLWWEIRVISGFACLIALIYTLSVFIHHGRLPFLSDQDIASLPRLKLSYRLSFWWNIPAALGWVMIIIAIFNSLRLKREIGKRMVLILGWLIIVIGPAASLCFGGMFYGLIACLSFLLVMAGLLAAELILKFLGAVYC